jgi:hypothetical protein
MIIFKAENRVSCKVIIIKAEDELPAAAQDVHVSLYGANVTYRLKLCMDIGQG